MSIPFTNVVGRPFTKSVRKELEKRKSLDQRFENTSDLYLPYFSLRRLKSIDSLNQSTTVTEEDYLEAPYSHLKNETQNYGLNEIIADGNEFRGRPAIVNMNVEMSDFTFYTITVDFIIPDINNFKTFKNTWFNFGIPVEIEFGKKSLVDIPVGKNDVSPTREIRRGSLVKFNYNLNGSARTIEGTLTIYATTWLSVFEEANATEDETKNLRENLKGKIRNYISLDNLKKLDVPDVSSSRDYIYSSIDSRKPIADYVPTEVVEYSYSKTGALLKKMDLEGAVKLHEELFPECFNIIDRTKFNGLEDYILSTFALDKKEYGTKAYYFVSMRAIEKIIDDYYQETRGENIQKFYLSEVPINAEMFKSFSSKQIDRVLINPHDKKYIKTEDGKYIEDQRGEIYLLGDVYISAPTLWNIIDHAKHILSFVETLANTIKYASANMIDIDQKIVWTDVSEDSLYAETGITYFDRKTLRDYENEEYTVIDLYDPREKIADVDIQTEISDDIAQMIFFMSRNKENKKSALSEFYYRRERLFADNLRSSYNKTIRNNRHTSLRVPFGKIFAGAVEKRIENEYSEVSEREFYRQITHSEAGKELLKNIDLSFETAFGTIQNRVVQFIESDNIESDNIDAATKHSMIALLTYIYMYFDILTEINKMNQELNYAGNSLIQIPLTVSFTMDGISGILPSQAFKLNENAFPVAYLEVDKPLLFVVNSLSHTLSGNDWRTTLSGIFYINPSGVAEPEKLADINKESYLYRNYLFALRYALLNRIKEFADEQQNVAETLDSVGYFDTYLPEEYLVRAIDSLLK